MAASRPSLAVVAKISCLAVFLAGINPAFCQNDSLTLKSVRGPFHPFSMENTWAQKTCEIQNPTDQQQNLAVKTRVQDAALGKLEFKREISVPSQAVRQINFAMRFGNFEDSAEAAPASSKHQMAKFNQTFTLNDAATGKQLALQQALLLGAPEKSFRLAILGMPSGDTFSYFKDNNESPFGNIQFISASGVTNLPTTWYGYSILEMLMLGPIDDAEFLPSQFTAMERWVRKGGKLLIFCGEGSYEQLQGRLGRLAGVCPIGFHHTDKLSTNGQSCKLDTPTYFAELVATDSEVLATCDTLPLVTARRTGMGLVIVVATSLNSLQPQNDFNVWRDIADKVKARHAIITENFSKAVPVKEMVKVDTPATKNVKNKNSKRRQLSGPRYVSKTKDIVPGFATLQEIAGRKAPDRIIPCAILGGLVLATILFGGLLRIWRRGEVLWMLLLPAVILIAAGIFYLGQRSGDPVRLTNVGYVTAVGNGQSHVQEFYAFYSGPKAITESFGSDCKNGIISPAGQSTLAGMITQTIATTDTQMTMPDKRLKPNDTSSFFVETVTDYDPMNVSLSFDINGAVAKISNNTNKPVENAVLFSNMQTMRIGTIQPGESTVRLTNEDLLAASEFTSSLVQQDTKWNDLISLMLDNGGFHETISSPRLLGHLSGSVISPLSKTANVRIQGVSVLDIPVTLAAVKPATTVDIPSAFLPTDIVNLQTPVWNSATREFNSCTRPSKMLYFVGLPKNIKKLKKSVSLQIVINIQAPGYTMKISRPRLIMKETTSSRQRLSAAAVKVYQSVNNPAGSYTINIPDADKLPVQDGMMGVLVEVNKLESEIAKTISSINVMGSSNQATWKIVSITPTLKGTVE